MDNTGAGNALLYLGRALSRGTVTPATSAAVWYIQKFSYDNNGIVNLIQTATNGDSNIWDNRAALTYV